MIKKMIKYGVQVNPITKKNDKNRSGDDQIRQILEQDMLSEFFHVKKIPFEAAKIKRLDQNFPAPVG